MAEDHKVVQFELSKELKSKIQNIFYDTDNNRLDIYINKSTSLISKVDKSSMRNTLTQFDKSMDGTLDQNTKLLCVYSIKYHLWKYIKFNDTEQKWYSENYPDDPSLSVDKEQGEEGEEEKKPRKAELVLSSARANYNKLFLDEYQVPHAAISINGHLEILPLRSKRFRNWIAGIVYKESRIVVDSHTIKDIIGVLSAEAEFNNQEPIKLDLRVASRTDNNNITVWFIDLTNKDWEFVAINADQWNIINNTIIFRRYPNQSPQVHPSRDYPDDIFNKFMDLLNIEGEDNRLLLKCYIVTMFIPEVPKVILMLHGEQGSAKTTLEELIKMIVDPSIVKTFAFPKDITEFIQQLSHSYVTYYDNISTLRDWVSDLLCRAVTGSGFSKRVLYTDDDDFIYSMKRCVGFNGINLGATKADLLDRGLIILLKRLRKDKWRKIEDIWKDFEVLRPQLLGYICDILVKVRKWKEQNRPLNLKGLSRMADWTEYGEIVSRCMGNENEKFLKAYYKNIDLQIEEVLESSALAIVVRDFIACMNVSSETPTKLLNLLDAKAQTLGINTKSTTWPKGASQLSRKLKELVTSLREVGIEVEWSKEPKTKTRVIIIRNLSSPSSPPSPNENQAQNSERGDYAGDGSDGSDGSLHKTKPPPRPPAYT